MAYLFYAHPFDVWMQERDLLLSSVYLRMQITGSAVHALRQYLYCVAIEYTYLSNIDIQTIRIFSRWFVFVPFKIMVEKIEN